MEDTQRVIALGFFDGVHIGHGELLKRTKQRANSAIGREEIIRRCYGIDNVVFIHFSPYVMRMDWRDFLESLVQDLQVRHIVVGHDFCFGYKGQGNVERLQQYCREKGLGCDVIPPVMLDGQIVSSTRIRELIAAGEIEEANRWLGHPHTLADTVHSGYHLGRKLGTPTINMFFPQGVVVPRHGVYASKVFLGGGASYIAVTNVGVRPTVSNDDRVSVESHLLDYSGNLYGRQARVEFYSFLRGEVKFESFEALSEQIHRDAEAARAYFAAKA